jgi:polyhydroxybutyrate depolymerase
MMSGMLRSALLLPILLLAGCAAPPVPPGPSPSASPAAGSSTHTLRVDGRDRTYRRYRPASLPAGPRPLVVVLHGAAGSGEQAERAYGWNAVADRNGFVLAYPDGVNRTWNASPDCCGVAARDQVDDVGFIRRLVAATSAGGPVFVAGISNGALLAYRLACETTIFTGLAAVAGTMINDCPAPHPLSVIHVHGTEDHTIPYAGGPGRRGNNGSGRLPVKIDGPAVPDLVAFWRQVDACPAPAVTTAASVSTALARCPDRRRVELITVAGAGHQWPGAPGPGPLASRLLHLDPPSTALNATEAIWQFFTAP